MQVKQGGDMGRRTQAERTDATTARLIEAAASLFGRDGYAATSIDAVAAAAGLTKGAAYHHFPGKAALFHVVFVRELEQVTAALDTVADEEADSWSALRRGCRTFLGHCLDPGFRRIVLLDGPSVLGWDKVREIEYGYLLRVLTEAVRGTGMDGDPTARAQLLFGALCEGGMLLARSDDPAATLATVGAEAERLLAALAGGPGVAPR
jgi:AcrR family transcriptional regulator